MLYSWKEQPEVYFCSVNMFTYPFNYRFESMSPNTERWDSLFFVGGPVWAMEWGPVPEGAAHTQYAALYCNRNMDTRHKINTLHTEHGLLQLWDLGKLQTSR